MKLALLALVLTTLEPLEADKPASVRVALAFTAYMPDTSTLRIDAVWLSLQDVQLRPTSACNAAAARPLATGPLAIELIRGTAIDTARVTSGRYCAMQLRLQRARAKPAELRGVSIALHGRRADGVRFVLRSRIEPSVLLAARDLEGISVDAGKAWLVGVDVARWLHGIDLDGAELPDSGRVREILIDDKHNPELLAAFNANVEAGLALYLDANEDRVLDPDERARPIASPR